MAQLVVLGADPSAAAQAARLDAASRPPAATGSAGPLRILALPARVAVEPLLVAAPGREDGPDWALLGVGGDELAPVGADLDRDGRAFLVCGPSGSGRSTVLTTMVRSLLVRDRPVVVVAGPRSPLTALAPHPGLRLFAPGDVEAVARVAAAVLDAVVVCDDLETVVDGPMEAALSTALRQGGRLVLSGRSDDLAASFRGLGAEARRSRHGLLLSPRGGIEDDLLGTRVPRLMAAPPGRGVLVRAGRTEVVQVAA